MKNLLDIILLSIWTMAVYGLGFHDGAQSVPATKTVLVVPTENASVSVPVPPTLNARQSSLLKMAYDQAKADGLPHPQLLQGILLQETQAGALPRYKVAGQESGLGVNQRYYGVAQIKLAAARDVLRRYPDLWNRFGFHTRTDEEVIAELILNDEFNITVASKYLTLLQGSGYNSARALAVAYNKGPGGAQGVDVHADPYANGVLTHLSTIGPKGVYHVQVGDTLSNIAVKLGVSMDTLFRLNPSAFVNHDRDVLMADVDLVLPRGEA